MERKRTNCSCRGMSIVEAAIAMVVLAIAIIGTINFRYNSILNTTRANLRDSAARAALMLCEGWRGMDGDASYDPVATFGTDYVTADTSGPVEPDTFTLQGKYTVHLNGHDFFGTLSYLDVDQTFRTLNVSIAWEARNNNNTTFEQADKIYRLTTYTPR